MEQQIITVIISILTVLTSATAWKFWEKRMVLNAEKDKDLKADGRLFREDLKDRVLKLETLLTESSKEKDKMRENIIILTAQISKLEVEVEFLRRENEMLRQENHLLRSKV